MPILAFVAWLVIFVGIRLVSSDFLLRDRHEPFLPYVAVPFEPRGDVVSLVPHLFRALFLVALSVAAVELAKIIATATAHVRLWVIGFSAYQVLLVVDGMRGLAPDWTTYGLYFAGLAQRDHSTYDFSRLIVPYAAPWFSFVAFAIIAILWLNVETRTGATPLEGRSTRTIA